MVKRKKSVNFLSNNIIYRPKIDDETNDLINDLNTEIIILNTKLQESYDENDYNKEIIKKLKKELEKKTDTIDKKPKKIYSDPKYPIYYMYIPIYQLNHQYPSYSPYYIYPNIYYN